MPKQLHSEDFSLVFDTIFLYFKENIIIKNHVEVYLVNKGNYCFVHCITRDDESATDYVFQHSTSESVSPRKPKGKPRQINSLKPKAWSNSKYFNALWTLWLNGRLKS